MIIDKLLKLYVPEPEIYTIQPLDAPLTTSFIVELIISATPVVYNCIAPNLALISVKVQLITLRFPLPPTFKPQELPLADETPVKTRLVNSKVQSFSRHSNTFAPLLLNITLPSPTKDKVLLRLIFP